MQWHPDKNAHHPWAQERAAEIMTAVNEAFTVLSDRQKRKRFDEKYQDYLD